MFAAMRGVLSYAVTMHSPELALESLRAIQRTQMKQGERGITREHERGITLWCDM